MKLYTISIVVLMTLLSACAGRNVRVLNASWTSMKHGSAPDTSKLVRVANIDEEFCLDSWSGTFGLMDEAVKKAEAKHQLDYIKNPSFSITEGKACGQIVGEGYRIQ